MIQFLCDTCSIAKQPGELWILGLAAEAVGVTAARREVNILSEWDRVHAVHPLAVHFCSQACKESYVDRLFGGEVEEPVERNKVQIVRSQPKTVRRRSPARKKKSRRRAA